MTRLLRSDRMLQVRVILAGAAMLLLASMFLPLWSTAMTSPQYHGEDTIVVRVYPGRIAGNLREVKTLNQYIGVRLPLDTPELRAMPLALGALLLLTLAAILVPDALRVKAMAANFALMLVGGAAGAAMLQYRLYQIGHERAHAVLRGISDFTPPLLGSVRIANFQIDTGLMAGGWSIALAVALTGFAILVARRRAPEFVLAPYVGHAQVSE